MFRKDGLERLEPPQNFDGKYVNDYFEWLQEKSGGRFEESDSGLQHNSWATRPSPVPEELHNNSWVATRGIAFLRQRDPGRPFFLNLSFHRPHAPLDPPQAYWDMYRDREIPSVPVGEWAAENDVPVTSLNAWRGRLPDDVLADARRAYYAQIAHIDNQIGRVLLALDELHIGPTWIIFTSDHGEMLGDHHLFRKCYAYEGSAKVPLIVCPPAGGRANICDAPVVLQDIYPTILEAAEADIPERTEGISLLPFVTGSTGNQHVREFVHGEHSPCYHPDLGMHFLTDGRQKYLWYTSTGREQLFDLENDPDELQDLTSNAAWKDTLQAWRGRLVKLLADRPQDGLSDGKKLLASKSRKSS